MRNGSSHRHAADGSTFLGTIVALVLILAIAGAAYPFFSAASGAIGRATARGVGAARAILLASTLNDLASRVRPPFWAAPAIDTATDSISWGWVEGKRESEFAISVGENSLTVISEGSNYQIKGIDSPRVEWLRGPCGSSAGISVRFALGGVDYKMDTPFGAFPFSR